MTTATPAPLLLWFRRDLRLADNPALAHAVESGRPVIPVYVLDPVLEGRAIGAASRWWLDKSLRVLAQALHAVGSRLILRRGDSLQVLRGLVAETGAAALVCNRLYEPAAASRDEALTAALVAEGVEVERFNASHLAEPGTVLSGAGTPYGVFTPFYRALRARPLNDFSAPAPGSLAGPADWPAGDDIGAWRLHPRAPDWSSGFEDWRPGERGASGALWRFVDEQLEAYPRARDLPGVEGTSRLSPHLHFGEIAPWRLLATAEFSDVPEASKEKLRAEIAWREFNAHLLHAFPRMVEASLKPVFDALAWRSDPEGLRAWQKGLTGYPIVDAGMRELWATGFMHNRVRMITASFLVKDLLIDWREGEAWFWDTLVDADLANNAGNWQWTAGSGADASPWFRIFNPVLQGQRFDPLGLYVRRWVPELAALPDEAIHEPWKAPTPVLKAAGVILDTTYPRPIVDHAAARLRALDALKAVTRRDQL